MRQCQKATKDAGGLLRVARSLFAGADQLPDQLAIETVFDGSFAFFVVLGDYLVEGTPHVVRQVSTF